jgi:hypothetical protein
MFCGFFRMVSGMQMVAMGNMGMMCGLFMATADGVLGCFFAMAGRMFMMLRRFCMMLFAWLAHRERLSYRLDLGLAQLPNMRWQCDEMDVVEITLICFTRHNGPEQKLADRSRRGRVCLLGCTVPVRWTKVAQRKLSFPCHSPMS